MITRGLAIAWLSSFCLSGQDAAEIVRRSVYADQRTLEQAKDYTYQETEVERDLDSSGKVTSTQSRTFDVLILYGRPFRKLVAKNGGPLSSREQAEQDAKLQKAIDQRKKESEQELAKQERQAEKEQNQIRKVAGEIPNACNLTLIGEEQVAGRPAYVVQAEPHPGYKSPDSRARLLSKLHGKLWIDKADYHWAKLEAEPIDTVSFGLLLARVSPGTRIEIDQMRVNDEIWAPSHIRVRLDARLALLMKFRKEIDISYTGYKKFKTDSRVVATSSEPAR
jgi:hypothetical protein